jgi:5-methylcytosine-specific restriction protein A
MARSVEEWVGKTDNTPVPERALERLWKACGKRCQGCGLDLSDQAWDVDHVIALVNWVPTAEKPHGNREGNLQVLGVKCCHRAKTKEDMKIKWQTSRKVRHHAGIKRSRNPVPGSKNTRFKRKYNRETGRFETWDRVTRDWVGNRRTG